MAKARSSTRRARSDGESGAGGLVAGAVAGGLVSGAGGSTLTTCKSDDTSFYCTFVRWFNMFKMVLYMIVVLVIIVVLWKAFGGASKKMKK